MAMTVLPHSEAQDGGRSRVSYRFESRCNWDVLSDTSSNEASLGFSSTDSPDCREEILAPLLKKRYLVIPSGTGHLLRLSLPQVFGNSQQHVRCKGRVDGL